MKNVFFDKLNSIVVVNIKCKNKERLLNKIYSLNIDVLSLEVINNKEVNVEIYECDLPKIRKISILNKVTILNYKGLKRVKKKFHFYKYYIISIIFGFFVLIILTNIIFSIEVSHTSSKLKDLIYSELSKNGIKKYQFKKSFDELEKVKSKILEDNKDKIEWLEIERVGTKYIIKVEERKINNIKSDDKYQDIVSTKDAVIKKIVAVSGEVVREVNEYVSKGDTIISGSVYLNGELKGLTKADGIVYGEVWYKLSIEYPKVDIVKEETGNKKEVLSINFLNKSIRLFEGKKYEYSIVKKNYLFKNNILPISISKDKMYELKVISGIYTDGEALLNARKYSRRKIEETLKENEYIISDKVLNYRVNSNTIYMDVFYKVYSNITGIKEIVGDNND